MQSVAAQLDGRFRQAIRSALGLDADPLVAPSQNERFGDYQANAAMGLAREVAGRTGQKVSPRAIADQIKARLELGDMASEVSIAGPGFINVRLSPAWLSRQIAALAGDKRLGIDPKAAPHRVVVDYSGPNIAKDMHVGHLRSTIIGDCLARVLEFEGDSVIRQNHVGDWGLQMGMVTYALERHGGGSLSLADLERLYKEISKDSEDPAVRRQMAQRTRELQQTPREQLAGWKQVRDLTLKNAHDLYARLNVKLSEGDVRGESFYSDRYAAMVEQLKREGKAVETEGAVGIFVPGFSNKEGQPRPFIIQSRDGTYQYPTFDLAALTFRVRELGAQRIIYTHDSRQAEHFAMLFAVAKVLGLDRTDGPDVRMEYAPFGTMLGEDGKPYKTRSGENVKLSALIDEAEQRAMRIVTQKNADLPEDQRRAIAHAVGVGAIKYADLSKERISDYVFSWDQMLAMDGNTAPYLQYAYARIRSIFRKAAERSGPGLANSAHDDSVDLRQPHEIALAKHILRLAEIVALVSRELKPHHLCGYLYDLATKFSGFYENCPVLQSDEPVRTSRLLLCDVTARTLALGLDLLGIEHPEQM
jgi:arginyl-tRNA synthetase